MITLHCSVASCGNDGTVAGVWAPRDPTRSTRRIYCLDCARGYWFDGSFAPDNEADLHEPQRLSDEQLARLARFEAAPPAPESFDARAAILRIQRLVEDWEGEAKAYERTATRYRQTGRRSAASAWEDKADSLATYAREIRQAIEGDDA